jgi:hypothetical protein
MAIARACGENCAPRPHGRVFAAAGYQGSPARPDAPARPLGLTPPAERRIFVLRRLGSPPCRQLRRALPALPTTGVFSVMSIATRLSPTAPTNPRGLLSRSPRLGSISYGSAHCKPPRSRRDRSSCACIDEAKRFFDYSTTCTAGRVRKRLWEAHRCAELWRLPPVKNPYFTQAGPYSRERPSTAASTVTRIMRVEDVAFLAKSGR